MFISIVSLLTAQDIDIYIHAFFYKSNTFVSNIKQKLVKNQVKANQHPEVEFSLFERCYPKIIGHILKYLQINKCNCFNEIT